MYFLHFDGLYRDHWFLNQHEEIQRGLMCYGWLIHLNHQIIGRGHGALYHPSLASSNGAEYLALIEGLEALSDLGLQHEEILVIGDNKSVIEQMKGAVGVSSPRVSELYYRANRLCGKFRKLHWAWAPRKRNYEADQLTRRALKQIISNGQVTLENSGNPHGFKPILSVSLIQR